MLGERFLLLAVLVVASAPILLHLRRRGAPVWAVAAVAAVVLVGAVLVFTVTPGPAADNGEHRFEALRPRLLPRAAVAEGDGVADGRDAEDAGGVGHRGEEPVDERHAPGRAIGIAIAPRLGPAPAP